LVYLFSKKVSAKKKILLKKELLNQYSDYTKEELLVELADLKGENRALKEHPQVQNNIEKQQINNFYIEVPPAFLTLETFPTLTYLFKKKVSQKFR
jgi:hypothetical protein